MIITSQKAKNIHYILKIHTGFSAFSDGKNKINPYLPYRYFQWTVTPNKDIFKAGLVGHRFWANFLGHLLADAAIKSAIILLF